MTQYCPICHNHTKTYCACGKLTRTGRCPSCGYARCGACRRTNQWGFCVGCWESKRAEVKAERKRAYMKQAKVKHRDKVRALGNRNTGAA